MFKLTRPSRRALFRLCLLAATAPALLLVGAELWWLYHAKRFQEVRPGFLYRTGQPSERGLEYLIRTKGIRTVVTLQTFDPTLKAGTYDPGRPSGRMESQFAKDFHIRLEQWPLGEEACWPWPAPWHLEEYLKLLDEPSNRPVLIHCQGGRHRTGTLAAIFRLEYDRWSPNRALKEMYSFGFGDPVPWQELNLRTYVPRPRPGPRQWAILKQALSPLAAATPPSDYEELVLMLRHHRDRTRLRRAVETYLKGHQPFALPLAARLIDSPDDPLAPVAVAEAVRALREDQATDADWTAAAAIIADFGDIDVQQELLALLSSEPRTLPVGSRYAALVRGVTNRYTRNRLPYIRPLLDDTRSRPEPEAAGTRYCDTAVARMIGIVDIVFYERDTKNGWDGGRRWALEWWTKHQDEIQLTRLIPPGGPRLVHAMQPGDEQEGPKRR